MARKQRTSKETKELFRDPSGQPHLFEKSYQEELEAKAKNQVECLGMTFENDEGRRVYFLDKLREKLKNPEFRKIEGFPVGSDEDILALSDPPYYTACPNPFIEDFIRCYGKPYDPKTDNYRREPFAADVSEGKNDPIYNAHSYHTKVPHKAIMRYILHYTEPGDVVFDGFGGTGMTGVAAQLCDSKKEVESLGYKVRSDGAILDEKGRTFSKIGGRRAILNDLSPAATFIACNYNTPVDVKAFEREAKRILKEVEDECGWMYETTHTDGESKARINYTVWSDVFVCPECTREVVFWEAAVDKKAGKVNDEFPCPHCRALLTKRRMERAWVTKFDKAINQTTHQSKQVPVLINYSVGKKRYEKTPGALDLALTEKIEQSDIPYWFPTDRMIKGDKTSDPFNVGITNAHHFYTPRNLMILSSFWAKAVKFPSVRLVATSCLNRNLHKGNAFIINKHNPRGRINGPLTGTLFIPSIGVEQNPFELFSYRSEFLKRGFEGLSKFIQYGNFVDTRSSTQKAISNCLVDYIFVDPPFGGNLMYSELSFLWEAWLRVLTNKRPEAIQNKSQHKTLGDYKTLMIQCFENYFACLKPGRWMTVEFHNSLNSVWTAIQEAFENAGFVVADVRTLDKKHGGVKAAFMANSVKQDLIISAYKPNGGLEERFKLTAGTEEGAWDFIRTHLRQLPVFVSTDGQAEVIAERQNFLLFDRMVAFHVQRGVTVPLSAAEFYRGVAQRFPEREGMYFLPEQVAEYDKKRMTVKEMFQLELFVTDESSAIQWLRQQLTKKPQTAGELKPQFMQEIGGWQKNEKLLEMDELLAQNFLRYDGDGDVPSQIHSYLSTNFKELRNLSKDDPVLQAKAKDRWCVPDPNKAGDLEKLRERALLKEFNEYQESKQRQLKVFRLEAVRAGFKKAWQERNYKMIIEVARKIPESVLQEDPKLLMWYDQALTRTGGES
jgi:DNA modification methylase